MAIDIIKEFNGSRTILLTVSSLNYNTFVPVIARQVAKDNKICYVTLNKTAKSLKERFRKEKVNLKNIVFVDCISKTIIDVKNTRGITYVDTPNSLTEIGLQISDALNSGFNFIIFDSVTTLLVYQKTMNIGKFIANISNKVSIKNGRALFYVLSLAEQKAMIQEISVAMDKVVSLE